MSLSDLLGSSQSSRSGSGLSSRDILRDESIRFATETTQSGSFDLELRTREGDRVVVQISAAGRQAASRLLSEEGESSSEQRRQNISLQTSVVGELSEAEANSVERFLVDVQSRVGQIVDDFFAGQDVTSSAVSSLLALNVDEELAGFDLALNLREESTTVVLYRPPSAAASGDAAPSALAELVAAVRDEQRRVFAQAPTELTRAAAAGLTRQTTVDAFVDALQRVASEYVTQTTNPSVPSEKLVAESLV